MPNLTHPDYPKNINEILPSTPRRFRFSHHHEQHSRSPSPTTKVLEQTQRKDITKGRRRVLWLAAFCAIVSIVFVILVNIGSTHNRAVLRDIYFIKLDLSHIIPYKIPNAVLINSIAQSLGLRDFYQVGLWGYCEGYKATGVTYCSPPQTLYWFNPVEILSSQLLAGASIYLPSNISQILDIIRIVSHGMFGCYISGACVMALSLLIGWLPIYSRWWSGLVGFISFLGAALLVVASGIATAMFIIFRTVFASNYVQVSIGAYLGVSMFVFMWMTAGFAVTNFILQAGLCCCCRNSKRRMRKKYLAEDEREKTWLEREQGRNTSRSQSQTRDQDEGATTMSAEKPPVHQTMSQSSGDRMRALSTTRSATSSSRTPPTSNRNKPLSKSSS